MKYSLRIAWSALARNRVQASLAILGVMIGVAALVASLALGRGAQNALDEQLRAAGVNMILVSSGNYQTKRELRMDGGQAHGWLEPGARPQDPLRPGGLDHASRTAPAGGGATAALERAHQRVSGNDVEYCEPPRPVASAVGHTNAADRRSIHIRSPSRHGTRKRYREEPPG